MVIYLSQKVLVGGQYQRAPGAIQAPYLFLMLLVLLLESGVPVFFLHAVAAPV